MRDYVDKIVNKFLVWELPKTVRVDGCALTPEYNGIRTGTNLLTFAEARLMVVYLFSELLDEHENLQKFTTQYEESAREWKANYEELDAENKLLKLRLEKCKEQRLKLAKEVYGKQMYYNELAAIVRDRTFDKELDSITSDSIKRGEYV